MIFFRKELIYSLRYKTGTINRLISPFFLIYAYVLLASAYGEGKQVLKSMLAWYWLNQIFLGSEAAFMLSAWKEHLSILRCV